MTNDTTDDTAAIQSSCGKEVAEGITTVKQV